MYVSVIVRNKETRELLETETHGLFSNISFNADGSIDIEELGKCVDNSTRLQPDSKETYLNPEDYELISVTIYK